MAHKDLTLTRKMLEALEAIATVGDVTPEEWRILSIDVGTLRALDRRGYVVADELASGRLVWMLTFGGAAQVKAWGLPDRNRGRAG